MHLRTFFQPYLRKRRKEWGRGPWQREPDGAWFSHAGFGCLVARAHIGTWCGYVLVPEGHPWHGVERGDIRARVHGSVTWAQAGAGGAWEVGFDCAHSWDVTPVDLWLRRQYRKWRLGTGHLGRLLYREGVAYRTMQYAIAETQRLAEQAREEMEHAWTGTRESDHGEARGAAGEAEGEQAKAR